jgi:hypothetical protein
MTAKELGAYYTDSQVADRLVEWAVRLPSDSVLDPSFGGGVFLRSAAARIAALGGIPAGQIKGVEVDPLVHEEVGAKLRREYAIEPQGLIQDDFFALPPSAQQVDCVLGNPPFIRFHRFAGSMRERALNQAAMSGVKLSRLASSWAPFLVHAMSMLKRGGRLAMVVPAELTYATYAAPVLRHLKRSFRHLTLLSFRRKLFADINEDTYLLLAEGFGASNETFRFADYGQVDDLSIHEGQLRGASLDGDLDADAIGSGHSRFVELYLDPRAKGLYNRLKSSACIQPLGASADVGIGYVSGANGFFHLTRADVRERSIPEVFLRKAVFRGKGLNGLAFREADWEFASAQGDAGYLLMIPPGHAELPANVRRYLAEGESSGISQGFKCRNRKPWYAVPNVYVPDALLTYMSGRQPKLVANESDVIAPNTLHILRMRNGRSANLPALLAGWHTSLARLSMEVEGHAMGGGMLKIEPTEAERVRIPAVADVQWNEFLPSLEELVKAGRDDEARDLADEAILRTSIGLDRTECALLRLASEELAMRRMSKGLAA